MTPLAAVLLNSTCAGRLESFEDPPEAWARRWHHSRHSRRRRNRPDGRNEIAILSRRRSFAIVSQTSGLTASAKPDTGRARLVDRAASGLAAAGLGHQSWPVTSFATPFGSGGDGKMTFALPSTLGQLARTRKNIRWPAGGLSLCSSLSTFAEGRARRARARDAPNLFEI